jgi:Tat protein secretion system quality control protein TatD with DNase activity
MVVAAGECGLDYFRNFSPPAEQRRAFELQLGLAAEAGKPLFLHQRDAQEDFLAMLRAHQPAAVRGVLHCFTGGPAELEDCLALGLCVGITGWICDERRGQAQPAAEAAPSPQRTRVPSCCARRNGTLPAGFTRGACRGSDGECLQAFWPYTRARS